MGALHGCRAQPQADRELRTTWPPRPLSRTTTRYDCPFFCQVASAPATSPWMFHVNQTGSGRFALSRAHSHVGRQARSDRLPQRDGHSQSTKPCHRAHGSPSSRSLDIASCGEGHHSCGAVRRDHPHRRAGQMPNPIATSPRTRHSQCKGYFRQHLAECSSEVISTSGGLAEVAPAGRVAESMFATAWGDWRRGGGLCREANALETTVKAFRPYGATEQASRTSRDLLRGCSFGGSGGSHRMIHVKHRQPERPRESRKADALSLPRLGGGRCRLPSN